VVAERIEQPRVDIRQKVTGQGKYVEDLPLPPGTAHAAAVRSPFSHARIVSIDASRAEQVPGVLAVLHRDNVREYDVHDEHPSVDNHFIATDKARFDGDLVGMVVATDRRTARHAADLIEVEYERLPTLFSAADALAADAPLVHEHLSDNVALESSLEWGDVDGALRDAAHVFETSFTSPAIYHHPIEPAMSVLVEATPDGFEFWTPSNDPFDVVDVASKVLGVPREAIRVRVPYVGGNFGAKHLSPETLVAAAISRKIGRPVQYLASEEESFRVTSRHHMTYRARVGVSPEGTLLALDVELDVDTGAYFTGARIATTNAVNASWGGYRVPHMRSRARTAYTNKVPAAMFRNTGKNQTTFGLDCTMDSVARELGMNPIEFRLKNLMERGETLPTVLWKRDGKEAPAQSPAIDTDFSELVDRALEAIDWDGRVPGDAGQESGQRYARGRGIGVSVRRGSQLGTAVALATLHSDGRVEISHNAPDVGEGSHTVISVVAAQTLGVPQSQIVVGEPDTGNELMFSGTSSQRTTVQMGNAVRRACEDLKRRIAGAVASVAGGEDSDWTVVEGRARRGEHSMTFAEIAGAGTAPLRGRGSYEPGNVADTSFGSHDHWSPGAAAAEVEVDRDTGEIRVLKYSAVSDAGKILHFHSAKGQIEGGAVMGFGAALSEEVKYEEGQLLNADAFQYRLPLMADIPEDFTTVLLEHGDGPGPFGSKGIAQTSIPCVAPALCNAIYDATGVRLDAIPFTPEAILRAWGKLGE
jgi:CO/xanthine dehydrogenase Mo-binding subunit